MPTLREWLRQQAHVHVVGRLAGSQDHPRSKVQRLRPSLQRQDRWLEHHGDRHLPDSGLHDHFRHASARSDRYLNSPLGRYQSERAPVGRARESTARLSVRLDRSHAGAHQLVLKTSSKEAAVMTRSAQRARSSSEACWTSSGIPSGRFPNRNASCRKSTSAWPSLGAWPI